MPMTNMSLGFEEGGYTYGLCKCCKDREKQTKGSGLCLIGLGFISLSVVGCKGRLEQARRCKPIGIRKMTALKMTACPKP